MQAARRALLELVRAKDDVPDYWAELGKIQANMGSYGDAYYAFTRAHELDQSNVDYLRALSELALRTGDIAQAKSYADDLEILSPGDRWVKLVQGWSAFGELRYDDALKVSDSILAEAPFDPSGMALKGRALVGLHRAPEAIDLLTKQIQTQPSDAASAALLVRIYYAEKNWPQVAQLAQRVRGLNPSDQQNILMLIEGAFRSGNVGLGRNASFQILQPKADPTTISSVLELWASYWPSPQRIADTRRLAEAAASRDTKLVYAAYLSRFGGPMDAIRIASSTATLPVAATNAEANAVLADALSRLGKYGDAKPRFDAVLDFDPGNASALRGRSELELRTGNAAAALVDAQKLVTVLPASARDRLLLARAYAASGNKAWMERTLWSAFQDIPGDESILGALQALKKGDKDALTDLEAEYQRQRDNKLNRGLL